MRKVLLFISLVLPFVAMAADVTTDKFYINDFTIAPGEEKEIEVNLQSTQEYFSFQVNIYLPEGLSFVNYNPRRPNYASRTSRIPYSEDDPWSIMGKFEEGGDGSLLVTAYSPYLFDPIEPGDGALFKVKVKADENLNSDGMIYCKNSEVTNTEYNNFNGPDTECHVSVCRTASLAGVVAGGIEQARYQISDELSLVYVTDDGKTIYAKDAKGFAQQNEWPYQPTEAQIANNKVFDNPEKFDQSNWVALNLKEEITSNQLEGLMGSKVKVTGILKDRLNPEIDVDELTVESEGQPYNPNLYTVASFGEGNEWFVMPPKPQEYVSIHWAVYKDGCFYMPKSENGVNTEGLHGAVAVNTSIYEGAAFEDNSVYELTGIVKALNPRAVTSGVSIMSADVEDSEASPYYELYPITSTKTDTNPVTAINRIGIDKDDDTYYNLLGQPVSNPTPGIYIHRGKKVVVK